MFDAFMSGVYSVFTIAIMMAVGFFAEKKGWMKDGKEQLLGKLVVNIGLPCTLFHSFTTNFTKDSIAQIGWSFLIPGIVIMLMLGLGYLMAWAFKVKKERVTIFVMTVTFANLVFIGLPVVTSLFGDEVATIAMINFFAQTMIFWTLGIYLIRKSGTEKGDDASLTSRILKLFPPATIAFAIALIFIFFEIPLLGFADKSIKYLGNIVTPLALIFSGAMVARQGIRDLKPDRDVVLVLISRFVIAPILAFVVISFTQMPELNSQVTILQLSMPVMTQISIVAAIYGSDYKFAIRCFAVSTLVLFAYIPIAMVLMELLY